MNFAVTIQPNKQLVATFRHLGLLVICGFQLVLGSAAFALQTHSVGPDDSDAGVDFSEWTVMRPTGADAEFKTPGQTRYVERSFSPVQDQPPIKVRLYQTLLKEKNEMYIFGYHDLHFAPKGNKNAYKHGNYSAEAIQRRREISALLKSMKALAGAIEAD